MAETEIVKVDVFDIEYSGDFKSQYLPKEIPGITLTMPKRYKKEEREEVINGLINVYFTEMIDTPVDSFAWEEL